MCIYISKNLQVKTERNVLNLRVRPWVNQGLGDKARITDLAQTWHKCWVWEENDCGREIGQNILFPLS